ncbi:MAG: hypothetical protein LBT54_04890, partial [Bifidobacteriaceae bacterium]|nr:hypothetical protein [Bifidobacteriaceae bacterium]
MSSPTRRTNRTCHSAFGSAVSAALARTAVPAAPTRRAAVRAAAAVTALALALGAYAIAADWIDPPPARAAITYTTLGDAAGLKAVVYSNGNLAVTQNGVVQFYGPAGLIGNTYTPGAANGSVWLVNGKKYATRYLTSGNTESAVWAGDSGSLGEGAISRSGSTVAVQWSLDNLILRHEVTLRPGSQTIERAWSVGNFTGSRITGARLVSGGDTYFAGNDKGYAYYVGEMNMIYVVRDETSGIMAFRGTETTPMDKYFGGDYIQGRRQARDDVDLRGIYAPGLTDQAIYTQWNLPPIEPGETRRVTGEITFEPPGAVMVTGDSARSASPGETVTHSFLLVNVDSSAVTVRPSLSSALGWGARLVNPAAVTVAAKGAARVLAEVTVPDDAAAGASDVLTLNGTYAFGGADQAVSGTTVTTAYIPSWRATPYSGVYDAAPHPAITAITMEDGSDATARPDLTIQYSADGGATWTAAPPQVTGAGRLPVRVRIIEPGGETGAATVTADVSRAKLTAAVSDETVTAGETPSYAISYSGFAGGEGPSAVQAKPTAASAYNPANPHPGTYPITITGGAAANSDIDTSS